MKTDATLSTTRRDAVPWSDVTHPFLMEMEPGRAKQLLDHAQIVHFKEQELIFREGEPADRFFLVESGSVALEAHTEGRGLVRIDTAEKGDVFGWSWLFPPFAWHLQARAMEPTRAIVCDGARLLVLCEEDPVFGYDLMKRIVQVLIHRVIAMRKELGGIEAILNPAARPKIIH